VKQGEKDLTKVLKRGLRRFAVSPRGTDWLIECHNWAPAEDGIEEHETLISLGASGVSWGGEGKYVAEDFIRDITIRVTDYVDDDEIVTVAVFLDDVSRGNTDSNGEIILNNVTVGGHELKMTKTGYIDSDTDDLFNDHIMVI